MSEHTAGHKRIVPCPMVLTSLHTLPCNMECPWSDRNTWRWPDWKLVPYLSPRSCEIVLKLPNSSFFCSFYVILMSTSTEFIFPKFLYVTCIPSHSSSLFPMYVWRFPPLLKCYGMTFTSFYSTYDSPLKIAVYGPPRMCVSLINI